MAVTVRLRQKKEVPFKGPLPRSKQLPFGEQKSLGPRRDLIGNKKKLSGATEEFWNSRSPSLQA